MSESLRFDLLANDRASSVFNKVGNSAKDTESIFGKVGAGLAKVGKVAAVGLAAGIGAGAVALVGMTKNAVEDEASQRKLALALQNSVGATDKQISSVENYISKAGLATGVTDDEMRPAFQRLVESTGSIRKAQDEMAIAMDVSAGTGKSLESVTTAMMKANNGTTASLSKLGLKTKDAEGNTLSMKDALASMADTFEGQASAKADTLGGKMDRLKLIFDETKENIGAKLIPVLSDMGDWFLSKGIPAISAMGDWLGTHLMPTLKDVGGFIRDTVVPAVKTFVDGMRSGQGPGGQFADALKDVWGVIKPLGEFIRDNKTVVATFAGVILTVVAAAKVWAGVQAALNLVLAANPIGLVVLAVAALAAGLVYAYQNSETFRKVVDKTFDIVSGSITWFWNNVAQPVLSGLVGAIGKVIGAFADMVEGMSHVPGFGWLGGVADKMHAAADATNGLSDSINKIPTHKDVNIDVHVNTSQLDKVQHQLDTLGNSAGRSLADAGKGGGGGPDLTKVGYNLGDLVGKGFHGSFKDKVKAALAAVGALIKQSSDKLADLRAQAKQITDSVKSSMTGALDVGGLGAVNAETGVAANPAEQLAAFAAQSGVFTNALAEAAGHGLDSSLIAQVAALGPIQGLTAAQALAAMDSAQVASANASMAAVDRYANMLGQTVLTTTSLPEDIAREQAKLDVLNEIKKDLKDNPRNISFNIDIHDAVDPDKVVHSIKQWVKRNGKMHNVAD